jgi:hypothetical protein
LPEERRVLARVREADRVTVGMLEVAVFRGEY